MCPVHTIYSLHDAVQLVLIVDRLTGGAFIVRLRQEKQRRVTWLVVTTLSVNVVETRRRPQLQLHHAHGCVRQEGGSFPAAAGAAIKRAWHPEWS